jgi:dihydroflavonol-4-reductase
METKANTTAMKNIIYLVTGATGFLGGTVCRQLLARGEQVRALCLPNDKAMCFIPKEAAIYEGDLCDRIALEKFFTVPQGMETVVLHCASIVTVNPDFNQKVMDVNVGGTQNIIDLCLEHSECRKLVYVSSTGAIPELPKGQRICEVDHFEADKVLGCYSQSKALATQAVLDAVKNNGLKASIVYPTGILGPEDFAIGETTRTVIQIINGKMPVGIDGSFNLCDVRDLANGTILAAEKGKVGEGYILGNEEVSFRQFTQLLANECHIKPIKTFLSIGIANFIARMIEKQAKRKGTQPLMTTFSVYNLARNNQFDSSKARKELGYTTRSYQETIHDECLWLKKTGKISA